MANATESTNKSKANKKENKTMKKVNWETVKTVVIAVLITGIAAFIAGMQYQQRQNEQVKEEASNIVKSVQVEVEPSKKQ